MQFARLALGGLSLALVLSAMAAAQTPPATAGAAAPATAAAAAPGTSEATPLARFIPQEGLAFYLESAGLNSQPEAWKKTAAYKMLNDTPLGYMLEDVGAQILERGLRYIPVRKVTGAEIVTFVKHIVHHGYVYAINIDGKSADSVQMRLVLRNGAAKDIRPVASRFMGLIMGSGKKELAKKGGGRTVVVSTWTKGNWSWWAEKEDLVLSFMKAEHADAIIEALDGKRPSAVDHPTRAALLKSTQEDFVPVVHAFLDPTVFQGLKGSTGEFFKNVVSILGISRFEMQRGFHENALMNITKVVADKPHKGLFLMFSKKTFEKSALPPMPDGLDGFTILSMDTPKSYEAILSYLRKESPELEKKVTEWVDSIKAKAHIDINKDILPHLGPKIGFYVAPAKTAGTAKKADDTSNAPVAGASPLAIMLASGNLPKVVLIVDVDDSVALGKKLDELMIAVNRNLRELALSTAKAAGDANTGQGGGETAEATKGRRAARPSAFEFTPAGGSSKAWFFSMPSEFGRFPQGVRPTIRLGAKHLVVAINAEEARKALELKETTWQPSGDLAEVVAKLPSNLVFLSLADPRDITPVLLAGLPGLIQASVNASIAASKAAAGGAQANTGGMAGMPGMPGPGGAGAPGVGPQLGGTGPPGFAAGGGAGGPPATGPPGFAPGGGGGGPPGMGPPGFAKGNRPPGGGGGAPGGNPSDEPFRLEVDKSKLPSPSSLRALMFPSSMSVSMEDDGLKIVFREAFPELVSERTVVTAMLQPLIVKMMNSAGFKLNAAAAAGAESAAPAAGAGGPPAGAGGPPAGAGGPPAGAPGAPGGGAGAAPPGARGAGAPGPGAPGTPK